MANVRRNDPCPCGSGKKYKKCCLLEANGAEFQFRRFRQIHAELIPKLTDFAFENLPPELFEEAWKDFNDQQEVDAWDPASPMNVLFMPWFLFNCIVELKPPGSSEFTATTIAEQFLVQHLDLLTSAEQTLLLSSSRRPYALCEIDEVKPGVGITLFDLLRRIKYEVVERTASLTLKRGEIIYCATSDVLGFKSNVGTGPYALRPTAKLEVLDLRKWIIAQIDEEEIRTEHLHEFESDIRNVYLENVSAMLLPPQLANTDGDPLVPHKLFFHIESPDSAFHALKTLSLGKRKAQLMHGVELEEGLIVKAEIDWLGGKTEAKKRLGGPVLLGVLKIDNNQLGVEVNSKRRAARIRKLIEKRLGAGATYKTTLIEPIESQVQEAWLEASEPSGPESSSARYAQTSSISDDDYPELRAIMEEISRQHWETWFDLPVPALSGMTPREAAKTEEGRELLESLLLFYENSQADSIDSLLNADIPALRRELGME
jgi:hypothetical protein